MTSVYPPSVEIEISASVQTVWDVLLDGQRYPEWNRFIYKLEGDLTEIGPKIHMWVKLGKRTARPKMRIVTVEPPADDATPARWVHQYAGALAWGGLLWSERHHELHPIYDGAATLYKSWEPFRGALKPFIPFKLIDEGFKAQGAQLKTRCEAVGGT